MQVIINESRKFSVEELFFSTTDPRGQIRSGNEVFVRISDYSWEELNGRAHSVIRHPDNPRVVFRLLWDYISAGRPIAAYVKNRAKDGRYYWVLALVTPIPGGYLSIRFKPSSTLFRSAQELYGRLRDVERLVEAEGGGKKAAIAASEKALASEFASLGIPGYDAFMHLAMRQELQARDAELDRKADKPGKTVHAGGTGFARTASLCNRSVDLLKLLFGDLESYLQAAGTIREKAEVITVTAGAIRLLSLNASLEANRLGEAASALGKVFDSLQAVSADISDRCAALCDPLARFVSEVNAVVFDVGSAKLQIEMMSFFLAELMGSGGEAESHPGAGGVENAMDTLRLAFRETMLRTAHTVSELRRRLGSFSKTQYELFRCTRSLRIIYLTGRVEIARMPKKEQLDIIFDDVLKNVTATESELEQFSDAVITLEAHLLKASAHSAAIPAELLASDLRVSA